MLPGDGPPLRALPEADLWPITLAFDCDDSNNVGPYNLMVRWLAIDPCASMPKAQQTQLQTGYRFLFIADCDIPPELPARVHKPTTEIDNKIQHLIISDLKAPAGEDTKAYGFRLFVTIADAATVKLYFDTCVRYWSRPIDHVQLMDDSEGSHSSVTVDSDQFTKDGQNMRECPDVMFRLWRRPQLFETSSIFYNPLSSFCGT